MCKRKISAEEKMTAVNLYLAGKGSQKQIATAYGINQASFQTTGGFKEILAY